MKHRAIPVCFLLAWIGWYAHAQESRQSEDDRIVVAVDSIWRGASVGQGANWGITVSEPSEAVTVWMTLVRVRSGHVGLRDKPEGAKEARLVGTDGGEHEEILVLTDAPSVEKPKGVRKELDQGAVFVAIFAFPKADTPAVLKWTYAYWDSPESAECEYAEITIDLRAEDPPISSPAAAQEAEDPPISSPVAAQEAEDPPISSPVAAQEAEDPPISSPVAAQEDVTGAWYGTLDAGAMQLRIVIHVQLAEGGYSATLDSPDQDVTGFPLDEIVYEDGRLVFRSNAIGVEYEGRVNPGSTTIAGTFSQGGESFALDFGRTMPAAP